MSNKKKFVGFVDLGSWGKNIIRNLYELSVLHTACDSDKKTIVKWQKEYSDIAFITSWKKMLDHTDITAVVIATPAATHYEIAKISLLAGKDVFVEKPLALTVLEAVHNLFNSNTAKASTVI